LLSVLAVDSAHKGTTAVVILVPILALGLPIMDTLLAMLRRLLRALQVVCTDPERNEYRFFVVGSASVFRADRDHIHHRLVTLGLTQRRAVLLLHGACVVLGVTAALAVTARGAHATLLVAAVSVAMAVGIRKLGYGEVQILRRGTLLPLFELRVLSRRPFHALVDSGFIVVAYLGALLVANGFVLGPAARSYFLRSVVIVAAVKLMTFVYSDLYQRSYRYTNAADLVGVVKGVTGAEGAAAVVLAVVYGIPDHVAAVLLLDFYLTATLVVGARLSFKVLEVLARNNGTSDTHPVLICGAGTGGTTFLQQLQQNPGLGYEVIGFIDEQERLWGRKVNGIQVLGGLDKLPALIRQRHVRDVILADASMDERRTAALAQVCAGAGAQLRRFRFALDHVSAPSDLAPGAVPAQQARPPVPITATVQGT
ncbi:MAG: hypothetical protein ACE5I7_20420, partial [Candidatus Binatia bacterium]